MSYNNLHPGLLVHGARFLPDPNGKRSFVMLNDVMTYDMPIIQTSNIYGTGTMISPPLSPVLSPVMGMPGMGMPGMGMPGMGMPGMGMPVIPGVYVTSTSSPTKSEVNGDGKDKKGTTQQTNYYTVVTPPITNIRHLTHPDQDPQLQKKVIHHFYKNLKEIYFLTSKFKKLLEYIIVENNNARLVKSFEELKTNTNNSDYSLKVKFITENIFSKYDLELLLSKIIAKYSMLYSEDEYNIHWYNVKYSHAKLVEKAMYKKIKYRLQKKVNF